MKPQPYHKSFFDINELLDVRKRQIQPNGRPASRKWCEDVFGAPSWYSPTAESNEVAKRPAQLVIPLETTKVKILILGQLET